MLNFSTPMTQSLFTILATLAFAVYQLRSVHLSQAKRGETPGGVAGPKRGVQPKR